MSHSPHENVKKLTTDSQFSPVKVDFSSVSPKKGNLTGNPRLIRDHCAELYNLKQKWTALTVQGAAIIKQIIAHKLGIVPEHEHASDNQDDIGTSSSKINSEYPQELQKLCENLVNVKIKYEKVHTKMSRITQQLKNFTSLVMHQHLTTVGSPHSPGSTTSDPIFHTWLPDRFYESSAELLGMYSRELDVKRRVTESAAHVKDELRLNFLLAAWVHEPYIDSRAATVLEGMLLESGHRYL